MAPLSQLSRSVAGRVVLVTGAASGMGRATAHLFADEGAHVAVTDLGADRVEAVTKEITDAGLSSHGWVMDVADAEQVNRVVGEIVERFGALDMVINNAGIATFSPIDADDYEDHWALGIEVLLTAQTRVIRAALPHLRRSDCARIVNISSTAGMMGYAGINAYVASKWGVRGLTKAAAMELAPDGIRVLSIHPGPVRTPMTAGLGDGLIANQAIPRMGEPEEVTKLLLFLAADATFSTGSEWIADGGALRQLEQIVEPRGRLQVQDSLGVIRRGIVEPRTAP